MQRLTDREGMERITGLMSRIRTDEHVAATLFNVYINLCVTAFQSGNEAPSINEFLNAIVDDDHFIVLTTGEPA